MEMNKKCSVCGNEYQSDTVYDDLGFAITNPLCDSCYRIKTGYCVQPKTAMGHCERCSLVNYRLDCHNNKIA